jgi:hypothetical protein
MYSIKGSSMMCSGLSAGNISLLGQLLMVACVCSDKQNDINTEDGKANDTATASAVLRLILVRHAEAYRNLPGRQSVPDSMLDTLTPRGIKQADAVGKALKESGVQVATVLTAPTGRAGQTARTGAVPAPVRCSAAPAWHATTARIDPG